ncbi:MAG: hypothetical protein GX483_07885 [Actinomycetaceae bacterium]|nr:hypothetical protein [Actinomycetaceae bacterium]
MRKTRIVGLILAVTLGLSACAVEAAVPEPVLDKEGTAVLANENYSAFATEVVDNIAVADEAFDASLLGDRVTGPFYYERAALYDLAWIVSSVTIDPVTINTDGPALVSGTAFPRTLATFDETVKSGMAGSISFWVQSSPRANYQLWGVVDMFENPPAVELAGALETKQDGFPQVEAADYVVDPTTVATAYADYVTNGEMGEVTFNENDPFKREVERQAQTLLDALEDKGTVESTLSIPDGELVGIATDTGGLVIATAVQLDTTVTKTDDDIILRLGSLFGALYSGEADGVVEVDSSVYATYYSTIAFYIPPAGSDDPVHVLGASDMMLYSVTKPEDE